MPMSTTIARALPKAAHLRLVGRSSAHRRNGAKPMLDVILLAVGFAFFALSILYAFGCERL
jgi:hypothetical protein